MVDVASTTEFQALAARVTKLETATPPTPTPTPAPTPPPVDNNVTFYDDFQGTGVDFTKWNACFNYAVSGNNGDSTLESFAVNPNYAPTSAPELNPFRVANSVLSMQIKPVPPQFSSVCGSKKYSSGLLVTQGRFGQQYGYFEASLRSIGVFGAQVAFWMLPVDGSWPPELDVTEICGRDPRLNITTSHSSSGGNAASPPNQVIADSSAAFHTYGLEWTASQLTWFVDRKPVAQGPTPPDCKKPFYLLLSNYAGAASSWAGGPIPAGTAMPLNFDVAYVAAHLKRPFV